MLGVLFVGASVAEEAGPELRLGTLDLPPYGWKNADGSCHGIVYQMHQEIGERTGLRFTNEIVPFARMLDMLKNGQLDMVTSQPHDTAQQAGDPLIVQNKMNVIVGTNKNSRIHTHEDLRGKNFLYIIAASYPTLDGYPQNIYKVRNYQIMLKMLYARSLDAGVFSEPAYYYWMKKLGYSPGDFGQVIHTDTRDDWAFVRKDLPEETREKLRQAIVSLQQEQYYERLLEELKREANY
jgi:ABC-type amino acid transport substrate-binding protein